MTTEEKLRAAEQRIAELERDAAFDTESWLKADTARNNKIATLQRENAEMRAVVGPKCVCAHWQLQHEIRGASTHCYICERWCGPYDRIGMGLAPKEAANG